MDGDTDNRRAMEELVGKKIDVRLASEAEIGKALKAASKSTFEALPISLAHGVAAGRLPRHHEDPFDRVLIAQAIAEGLTIVTRDKRFDAYGVALLTA